jgi:16S rRNA (cytosine967-C5)-methyltransferase
VERWLTAWGLEKAETVCAANNEVAPLTVRANTLKAGVEVLEQRLRDEQVSVQKNTEVPEELEIVTSPRSVRELQSFRDGLFQVQDASSICAGHLLAPSPGDVVIDLCAGPGGKTTHLAQLMGNSGAIYAIDPKSHRLSLIRDNCRMLGVTIVRCIEGDARQISELGAPLADRALVDAPCMGTGTFRRRVDLKWRLTKDNIEQLVSVQKELIAAGASVLKPGGVLVYSVCSVDPAETEELVRDEFIRSIGVMVDSTCPPWMEQFRTSHGHVMIMPGQMQMDGFFMARFVKTG